MQFTQMRYNGKQQLNTSTKIHRYHERVGVQVKLKSLENTCHTWALLRWWFTTKSHYISSVCSCTFTFYLQGKEKLLGGTVHHAAIPGVGSGVQKVLRFFSLQPYRMTYSNQIWQINHRGQVLGSTMHQNLGKQSQMAQIQRYTLYMPTRRAIFAGDQTTKGNIFYRSILLQLQKHTKGDKISVPSPLK